MIPCVGCRALVPDVEAPAHRHVGCSPGCWAIFGEVLAREYSDYRYGRVHLITVDTYAAQHPGTPSPQSIRSVALHLLRLHCLLELGYEGERAYGIMRRAADRKRVYSWLDPPDHPGAL